MIDTHHAMFLESCSDTPSKELDILTKKFMSERHIVVSKVSMIGTNQGSLHVSTVPSLPCYDLLRSPMGPSRVILDELILLWFKSDANMPP